MAGAPDAAADPELEALEVDLLVELLWRRFGHDFRNYARASLSRRLQCAREALGLPTLAELIPRLLRDPEAEALRVVLESLSVAVTELFREPWTFKALGEAAFTRLRTYPFIKVWVAGCATGEEAYSLAVLFEEAGFGGRVRMYATDIDERSLERARDGIISAEALAQAERRYVSAGGRRSLKDYTCEAYGAARFEKALRDRITFANHNLATDGPFGEMQLISCRNVLIYFDTTLQRRVLELFRESLCHRGFLFLGSKESLRSLGDAASFDTLDASHRVFQRGGAT